MYNDSSVDSRRTVEMVAVAGGQAPPSKLDICVLVQNARYTLVGPGSGAHVAIASQRRTCGRMRAKYPSYVLLVGNSITRKPLLVCCCCCLRFTSSSPPIVAFILADCILLKIVRNRLASSMCHCLFWSV